MESTNTSESGKERVKRAWKGSERGGKRVRKPSLGEVKGVLGRSVRYREEERVRGE